MRVAVLGLGRMGAAIARRLEVAGHELLVWNRSAGPEAEFRERGAEVLAAPAEGLRRAELAITMLADGAALEEVALEGDLLSQSRGGILVDMSTISVESSARVAEEAARHGVSYLRAPVSGNPAVVAAGNLGLIVSGSREHFDALSPFLAAIGPNLFYVGPAEESRVVKLALNLVICGTVELLAEAVVLAESSGIGRRELLEVMNGSAIGSPFVKYKTEPLIADDYTSTFTATLAAKDLDLALDQAATTGAPLPLTAATRGLFALCIEQGLGDGDLTVLLPRLRKEAGLDS